MSNYYHVIAAEFSKGQRVELHPAHDQWMRGNRYGTVTHIGRSVVFVKLDKDATRRAPRWFHPASLAILED